MLRVFGNRVLRKIFGPTRDKVLGERGRRLKADSHIACCAHAVPLPCHAAKGLECVFPI